MQEVANDKVGNRLATSAFSGSGIPLETVFSIGLYFLQTASFKRCPGRIAKRGPLMSLALASSPVSH